jgi:hypothetical protein
MLSTAFRSRVLIATLIALASLTAPAVADLGPANNFAILSSSGHLSFGTLDIVYKIVNPRAATCPAGVACPVFVGGTSFTRGPNDRIFPHITTAVAAPGAGASAYSAFLSAQPATRTAGPIALKPGAVLSIQANPGLTVFSTPSMTLGSANPQSADPCAKSLGLPATIVIEATAGDTVVFNIGTVEKGGTLILCDQSRVLLTGGITPDRVTFNVAGRGRSVAIGAGSSVNGGILAPFQAFFTEDTIPGTPPTVINGSILAGGAVTIGNNALVRYYPPQNVGIPATIKFLGTVNVAKLPQVPQRTTTKQSEDDPPQPVIALPARQNFRGTHPSQVAVISTGAVAASRHALLTQVLNFAGVSQNGNTPSDVQLAAGTTTILEMANVTGAFYKNPGGAQIKTFDLGQFFLGSQGQGTDPRVYYDAVSKNFIVAYEMTPSGGDDIRLGIGSNPGGTFAIYDVANNNTGATFDQPKLGVSSDKIIISWNNYGTQHGASYIVIQKAGIVARNASVPGWIWTDDTSRFQIVPANQYSSDGGTHYAAWHCCGSSNIDLMAFTGVPGISPVNYTDNSYGIGSVAGPPAARQPAGGDATINTNDDRMLSTIWQNGELWATFNEGCTPSNDKTERACERYVQIGTPNAGVRQNVQMQWTGNDLYYSSVVQDAGSDRGVADLFFGLTASSPSQDPVAMVMEVPGSVFTSSTAARYELAGSKAFAACTTPCPRWGDYTAAGRDPNDPTKVWIANQYGGLSNQFWGTSVTEIGN